MRRELLTFGENIYSQAGEDGILAEVIRRLGWRFGRYVDIGAHDGLYMSNTERLRECGWRGLCIESDPDRYGELQRHLERYPHNEALRMAVTPDNVHNLADWDVALLDIDVDGPDLQIWRAMPLDNRAALVLIEVDAAAALGVMREHSAGPDGPSPWPPPVQEGRYSSFSSMIQEGQAARGYRLIAYTGLNCLFARNDLVDRIIEPTPADALYLNGPERIHYRKFMQQRSDARAQLKEFADGDD